MFENVKERMQKDNRIAARLTEYLLNNLLRSKERGRLTRAEKELLDSFLNETDIAGNPIWLRTPPTNNNEDKDGEP